MELGSINVLAVIVSGIAAMVVGLVWYSRALFESAWLVEIGHSRRSGRGFAIQVLDRLSGRAAGGLYPSRLDQHHGWSEPAASDPGGNCAMGEFRGDDQRGEFRFRRTELAAMVDRERQSSGDSIGHGRDTGSLDIGGLIGGIAI